MKARQFCNKFIVTICFRDVSFLQEELVQHLRLRVMLRGVLVLNIREVGFSYIQELDW